MLWSPGLWYWMPLSQRHHPVDFPPCPAGLGTWTPELGLETSGQARSLEIAQLRTCAYLGLCELRQWLESLMVPEPAKKLVLWGWHPVQLAKLERKMDQMMLHSTISLWFCVCCCSEGQTSFWPSHRDGRRGLVLRPWFSTKAVSDFWVWLLTTCSRLQLLLFYFVLQDLLLLLVHHYIMFYLYSQKLNTMLLFFGIECRFLGVQQMHETSGSPEEGHSELGKGTSDNSALPSKRGTHMCIDLS